MVVVFITLGLLDWLDFHPRASATLKHSEAIRIGSAIIRI